MSRSNMFANVENQIEFLDTESKIALATNLMDSIYEFVPESQMLFAVTTTSAQIGLIGMSSKKELSKNEKEITQEIFAKFNSGELSSTIEDTIIKTADEKSFEILEMILKGIPREAIKVLKLILCFAYIDDKPHIETLERLDGMYGMHLLADFMKSGAEEVPKPLVKIELTKLEKKIFDKFKKDDLFKNMKDLKEIFKKEDPSSVEEAIKSLCEKELLVEMDVYGGPCYCLMEN